jgi:hypothetical protein
VTSAPDGVGLALSTLKVVWLKEVIRRLGKNSNPIFRGFNLLALFGKTSEKISINGGTNEGPIMAILLQKVTVPTFPEVSAKKEQTIQIATKAIKLTRTKFSALLRLLEKTIAAKTSDEAKVIRYAEIINSIETKRKQPPFYQ